MHIRVLSLAVAITAAVLLAGCSATGSEQSGAVTADGGTVAIEVADLGTVHVASGASPATGSDGAAALRPEKVRIGAPGASGTGENRFAGTVTGLLYHGDVTVYRVRTTRGHEIEALLANSASGLARFFEVGDSVELWWPADAGHFVQ